MEGKSKVFDSSSYREDGLRGVLGNLGQMHELKPESATYLLRDLSKGSLHLVLICKVGRGLGCSQLLSKY